MDEKPKCHPPPGAWGVRIDQDRPEFGDFGDDAPAAAAVAGIVMVEPKPAR